MHEAQLFVQTLSAKRLHVGALVLNKVLPAYLLDEGAAERARKLTACAEDLAGDGGLAAEVGAEVDQVGRVLAEVGENFANFSVVAAAQAAARQELSRVPDVVAVAPELDDDIHDLAGLLALGRRIWG